MGTYILYLTVLCFSFLIFVFTITFYHKQPRFQGLGYTFLIPFYLSIYSFIYLEGSLNTSVISFIELVLMASLLLVLSIKGFQRSILATSVMILLILIPLSLILPKYGFHIILEKPLQIQIILTLLLLANMIPLFISRKKERNLYYCFVWLFIASVLQLTGMEGIIESLTISMKVFGYYGFYHYFYRRTYTAWERKVREVEKMKRSLQLSYEEEVRKQLFYMELEQERLLNEAHTDAMTQAYNKKAIINILEKLITIGKEPISIMMLDIDYFKRINDCHGHVIGDTCIKGIVEIIKENTRKLDYIGRYGGDEFIIILPETSMHNAKSIAEKIREKISFASNPRVTVSVGIASYPQDGRNAMTLIAKADEGLYRSKRKGRNIVSHATMF